MKTAFAVSIVLLVLSGASSFAAVAADEGLKKTEDPRMVSAVAEADHACALYAAQERRFIELLRTRSNDELKRSATEQTASVDGAYGRCRKARLEVDQAAKDWLGAASTRLLSLRLDGGVVLAQINPVKLKSKAFLEYRLPTAPTGGK